MRDLALAVSIALAMITPAHAVAGAQDHAGHAAPPTTESQPEDPPASDEHQEDAHGRHAEDAHAGHAQQSGAKEDHSAMDHSKMDHSKMDHGQAGHAAHAAGPAAPLEPIPVLSDDDRTAAFPPLAGHPTHDRRVVAYFGVDRLEAWREDGEWVQGWETTAWLGGDIHKAMLRTEGERDAHATDASVDLLYARAIAPWWDLVAGLRQDVVTGPDRVRAAVGLAGLAPGKFEVKATGLLGSDSRFTLELEAEYELLLTNRLILQPHVEVQIAARDDADRGEASGLIASEAGLRLRYEITRRFAPYVGIVHERTHGGTAALRRAAGQHTSDRQVVAGVRLWF